MDSLLNEHIKNTLAFRGGTALNKIFITPAARYSEDLDFVQIPDEPIGKTVNAIRSALDSWLGEPRRNFTKRGVKLIYRYKAADNSFAKLKIEINITEHFQIEPFQQYPFSVSSEWFDGDAFITSYTLDELMGTKLRALYQRRKGRDLFDLWFTLKNDLINVSNVISIFEKYCSFQKEPITRAMFEKSLHLKKQYQDFQVDILPLLTPEAQWDFSQAMSVVEDKFIQKLKGKSWQGNA
ncbi:MAG: nucleotidyl transferase AbiEii/AbiGii toxin family protein [Gammaproteobacteria bacterium]